MQTSFAVQMVFQGRATFMNMSRYSSVSERRFRRWSQRSFDYAHFNTQLPLQTFPEENGVYHRDCTGYCGAHNYLDNRRFFGFISFARGSRDLKNEKNRCYYCRNRNGGSNNWVCSS